MPASYHLNGGALRHLRKTRGHRSAADAAPHLHLTPDRLYALETGRTRASHETYHQILAYFGLDHGALLTTTCRTCGHPNP